jgi:hypothetical protein
MSSETKNNTIYQHDWCKRKRKIIMDWSQRVYKIVYAFKNPETGKIEIRVTDGQGTMQDEVKAALGDSYKTPWQDVIGFIKTRAYTKIMEGLQEIPNPTEEQLKAIFDLLNLVLECRHCGNLFFRDEFHWITGFGACGGKGAVCPTCYEEVINNLSGAGTAQPQERRLLCKQ